MKHIELPPVTIGFTLSDIKYDVEPAMLERARKLVFDNKIIGVTQLGAGYQSVVKGTKSYGVGVAQKGYDFGRCDCYMGQKDQLCKHMVALALWMLRKHKLTDEQLIKDLDEKTIKQTPKELIRAGCAKLRSYNGNSSQWFAYQNKLIVGTEMVREGLTKLPKDRETSKYLFSLAKRILKKIENGIDDSDGTVWPVIEDILHKIISCAEIDSEIHKDIQKWSTWESGFGFEDIFKTYLEKKNK